MLAREHWSQVFDQPSKASLERLASGDFRSVGLDEALERLAALTAFGVDQRHRLRLEALRKKRNRLEHFGLLDGIDALRGATAEALNALVDVMNDAAEDGVLPVGGDEARMQIVQALTEFDRFVEQRMQAVHLSTRLDGQDLFQCPTCLQDAAAIADGLDCAFCGSHGEASDAADHFAEAVLGVSRYETTKDGGCWPVFGCPSCHEDALVHTGEAARDFLCFSCGEGWRSGSLQPCVKCANMIPSGPESMCICDDCFGYAMGQD